MLTGIMHQVVAINSEPHFGSDSARKPLETPKRFNSLSYIPIKRTSDMPMEFDRSRRCKFFVIHMNSAMEKHQIGIDISNPFMDPGIGRRTQET